MENENEAPKYWTWRQDPRDSEPARNRFRGSSGLERIRKFPPPDDVDDTPVARQVASLIRDSIHRAVAFRVDSCIDAFYSNSRERWSPRDFPRAVPPFPAVWVEHRQPDGINRNGKVEALESAGLAIAWLLTVQPSFPERKKAEELFYPGYLRDKQPSDAPADFSERIVSGYTFGSNNEQTFGPLMGFEYGLNADADITAMIHIYKSAGLLGQEMPSISDLWAPWFALSMMNCTNVSQVITGPNRAERKRARRLRLKPRVTFRDLVIPGHLGARGSGGSHSPAALHVVRGHFKRRETGTFWWGSHARGDQAKGAVVKSYSVEPS